jgi:hypothetical protein
MEHGGVDNFVRLSNTSAIYYCDIQLIPLGRIVQSAQDDNVVDTPALSVVSLELNHRSCRLNFI